MEKADDVFVVRGPAEAFGSMQQAVAAMKLVPVSSGIEYVAINFVPVSADAARSVAALLEALEENDDVQKVHTNAEFPDGFEA
jgi:transcriptional/translational regulatory protein YebC/TACO1